MAENKSICLDCWGEGYVSRCCGHEMIETPNDREKCSCCGNFCKAEACAECQGTGYVDEDE